MVELDFGGASDVDELRSRWNGRLPPSGGRRVEEGERDA